MEKEFETNCFDKNISINSLFQKISNTHEFKEMINNISTTVKDLNENNKDNVNEDIISNKSSYINMNNIFLSKNGNNICDCLEKVNDTLQKLIVILEKTKN
jgi:primosomal protein N''